MYYISIKTEISRVLDTESRAPRSRENQFRKLIVAMVSYVTNILIYIPRNI